ncbi:MAG: hypothetical protein Q8L14_09320 [Myxococcales bacterium]|nr:hypothetical protein [Myxococcales bacterium]
MASRRTGDWARARELLSTTSVRLKGAVETALKQEAHALRNEVVRGLTAQAPGGDPIRPPAPLTLAARQLKGFGGTKSLLVRGDLRNSISVITDGDEVFVGVLRTAKSSTGESLADVAQLQEFGGPPVIIPITSKMRRFLSVLFKRAGVASTGGSGRGVVVTQVPARPFLRPAFEKFRARSGRRLLERIAEQLGLSP